MHEGLAAFLTAVGLMTCIGTVAVVASTTIQIIEADWIPNMKNERGLTI